MKNGSKMCNEEQCTCTTLHTMTTDQEIASFVKDQKEDVASCDIYMTTLALIQLPSEHNNEGLQENKE